MKNIKIVVQGISLDIEDADTAAVTTILKQAIEGQLAIQKQQDEAQHKLAVMQWGSLDNLTTKLHAYWQAGITQTHEMRMKYLERKAQLKSALGGGSRKP